MSDFVHEVALNALHVIARDAQDIYYRRRENTPELDADDAMKLAVQTAIYRTVDLLEPSETTDDEFLSKMYWNEVSS